MLFLDEINNKLFSKPKDGGNDIHQLSFWVKKYFIPEPLINCGNAPVKPNESGSHAVSHLFPNLDSKNL
jgi:hypothetical protein